MNIGDLAGILSLSVASQNGLLQPPVRLFVCMFGDLHHFLIYFIWVINWNFLRVGPLGELLGLHLIIIFFQSSELPPLMPLVALLDTFLGQALCLNSEAIEAKSVELRHFFVIFIICIKCFISPGRRKHGSNMIGLGLRRLWHLCRQAGISTCIYRHHRTFIVVLNVGVLDICLAGHYQIILLLTRIHRYNVHGCH